MRYDHLILSHLLLANVAHLYAQSPAADHAWINTGKVSARIASAGIHADSTGGFMMFKTTTDTLALNLLTHLAPWVGGLDPGGNLKLACEMDNPAVSDWQPGFRGIAGSGKIWKVTREQIDEHIADFQDNGVIDNPVPAVFAWPGWGNPYSMQWNGFSIPDYYVSAFFRDSDNDGMYNPANGDYPISAIRALPFVFPPEQIVYAPFFDNGLNLLTDAADMKVDGMLNAFTFDCANQDFVKNTVFFAYKFHYIDTLWADSVFFGIYADFDLGKFDDDYLGCTLPHSDKIFCYNSDTLNDAIAGQDPPMVCLLSYRGVLDTFGNENGVSRVMPIYGAGPFPGTIRPEADYEFYNYITGSWRDGSPLKFGGTGYVSSGALADFAYTGHPSYPEEWSEISSGNPLGGRECVISYGPIFLKPGAVNEVIFSLSVSDEPGPSKQLEQLSVFQYLQRYILKLTNDLPNPLDTLCFMPVSIDQPSSEIVSIYPNPAQNRVTIHTTISGIKEVAIFDVFGKKIQEKRILNYENQEIVLFVDNLPTGIYFLTWVMPDGRHGSGKIIVGR